MTRRCSHCCNKGHNSRTCPVRGGADGGGAASSGGGGAPPPSGGSTSGGVRLFGVRLTNGSIVKKSASMGNLSSALGQYNSSSSAAASPTPGSSPIDTGDGYVSDDPAHGSPSSNRRVERKRGNPWTQEEHRRFLVGLQKLGKGDWRGIAREYVMTRTPTQVASHAQKYFIRQSNSSQRKRRSSLFDMVPDMASDQPSLTEETAPPTLARQSDDTSSTTSPNPALDLEHVPMETSHQESAEGGSGDTVAMLPNGFPPMVPYYFSPYLTVPLPLWPPNMGPPKDDGVPETSNHRVLKPIPILPKEPVNADQLAGMSQLSLAENEPSPLSLKLLGETSRQSAFHFKPPSISDAGKDNCEDSATKAA